MNVWSEATTLAGTAARSRNGGFPPRKTKAPPTRLSQGRSFEQPPPPKPAQLQAYVYLGWATVEVLVFHGHRDVDLTTSDGVTLRGWFMRPQEANGDAVILLHGVSDNRLGMYGYGKWIVENHYSVLLPDARHHGNSGGLATYGVKEADDVHKWADWIETNDHPGCVYGMGESMGGAELL